MITFPPETSSRTLYTHPAHNIGRRASILNMSPVPYEDRFLMRYIAGCGRAQHALEAWSRGWYDEQAFNSPRPS